MASREEVSPDELVEILNEQLAQYRACEGCEVRKPPHRLQEPDEEGVNWSRNIHLDSTEGSAKACYKVLPKVVAEVASRYNLADE